MASFNPVDLSSWSGGEWTRLPDSLLKGFCIDSRKAALGELFVALRAQRDGHQYLQKAVSSGVVGALVDHHVESVDCPQLVVPNTLIAFQQIAQKHRDSFGGKVVGVTGSCGKTSTKEILRLLLSGAHCTEGNFNNHLGVPITLSRLSLTKHSHAVIEAGINQTREMDDLTRMINPDVCIITSIDHSHLAGLGTIQTVANEKIKLWLQAKKSCIGVFPEELLQFDAFSEAKKDRSFVVVKKKKIFSSEEDVNEVLYEISTETNERGHSLNLLIKRCGCPPLVIPVEHTSEGMIRNMVLACVVAWKLGVSDQEICERLPQYRPSGLRGSCLVGRGRSYVLDCYNANPSSMLDSIQFFFEKYRKQPKLLVLGGMNELGDLSQELHGQTGRSINLAPTDQAIIIGEYAKELADGMIENGASNEQISILNDTESARPLIEDFKGVVLLKGSRSYQLEELIPAWAVEEREPLKIAC